MRALSVFMPPPVQPFLPRHAHLPINRCNLPAVILGGLSFQRHPVPLVLDGVAELHAALFRLLDREDAAEVRAALFQQHMDAVFSLAHPEEAGYAPGSHTGRSKASYLRMLRGWAFDADGREGAVLKGWVESRFGLLPRHHGGPIRDFSGATYRHYLEQRSGGLYNTNSLEAQFDLLYTWCQYELRRRAPGQSHITLYRGVNRLESYEELLLAACRTLGSDSENELAMFRRSQNRSRRDQFSTISPGNSRTIAQEMGEKWAGAVGLQPEIPKSDRLLGENSHRVVLLNSLNSFTRDRERACEFGDHILEAQIPLAKIVFFHGLLPGKLKGEEEYAVIGGVCEVRLRDG